MVRLEKVLYEKLVNTRLFGRARIIDQPKKLDFNQEHYLRALPKPVFLMRLLNPFFCWLDGIEYRESRAMYLQRGISFDQGMMQTDMELARDPFHEHFMREATHPYHHTLNKWSRFAYSKVDIYLRGFEAPDYFREPARKRTYYECKEKIDAFNEMIYKTYQAECTTINQYYAGTIVILDLFIFYNSLMKMGWNRFFYNEAEYITANEYLKAHSLYRGDKKYNLSDPAERKQYHDFLIKYNQRYPGKIAPDGEEVDFDAILASWNKENANKEFNGEITDNDLREISGELQNPGQPFILSHKSHVIEDAEELSGSNNVGVDLPKYLQNREG